VASSQRVARKRKIESSPVRGSANRKGTEKKSRHGNIWGEREWYGGESPFQEAVGGNQPVRRVSGNLVTSGGEEMSKRELNLTRP